MEPDVFNDRLSEPKHEFRTRIGDMLAAMSMKRDTMTEGERAVMRLLYSAWVNNSGHISQAQIADSEPWLGAHPIHETYRSQESTLRQVRQIIRDLRLNHRAPILADNKGYWIPQDEDEVVDYLAARAAKARAQAAAWWETYRAMHDIFGTTARTFREEVDDLFKGIGETQTEEGRDGG